jgi:hypothetical protein
LEASISTLWAKQSRLAHSLAPMEFWAKGLRNRLGYSPYPPCSTDQITSVIVHRADLLAALSALVAVLNLGERLVALTTCCLGCAMQTHSVGVVLGTCVEQRFALFARRGQIFRGCRMRHSALLSTFLLLRKPISGGGRTSLLRLVVIK